MKHLNRSLIVLLVLSLLFTIIGLQAQEGEGKAVRKKQRRGGGIENMLKRVETLSPEVAAAFREVRERNPQSALKIIEPFTRDARSTAELKKTDETSFNLKVQITVMKLQAIALAEDVKSAPEDADAKKKLEEHLSVLLDLEKAALEAAIKALQAKLKEINEDKNSVIEKRVEEMTRKKEQPQQKKKEKKPKKEKQKGNREKKDKAADEHGDQEEDMME